MEVYSLPQLHDHDITDVQFSNDGKLLASCALDGTVAVYDVVLQRLSHHFDVPRSLSCICWTSEDRGSLALIVGSTSGTLHQISFRQDSVSSSLI
jgi:WD40 repeat protein